MLFYFQLRNIINNLEPFIKKAFEKYILEVRTGIGLYIKLNYFI